SRRVTSGIKNPSDPGTGPSGAGVTPGPGLGPGPLMKYSTNDPPGNLGCVMKAEQNLVCLLVVMLLRLPGGCGGRPRLGPGRGTPGMSADVTVCRTPRYIP